LRCTSRAIADIAVVASMMPACLFSYLVYKASFYAILFCLHSVVIDRAPEIARSLRQIYAEVKTEGLAALKSRVVRALRWPGLCWSAIKARIQAIYDRVLLARLFRWYMQMYGYSDEPMPEPAMLSA
jgi:hypothetical protein